MTTFSSSEGRYRYIATGMAAVGAVSDMRQRPAFMILTDMSRSAAVFHEVCYPLAGGTGGTEQ